MNISFTIRNLIITSAVVATVVVVFLVHALAGLRATPVVFAEPPAFVKQYVNEIGYLEPSSFSQAFVTDSGDADESNTAKLTVDFSQEEALVRNVILGGKSPDVILRLFTHTEKAKRVKIASAFAAVNGELTHDEESGFAAKREQFWLDAAEQLPDIQNALFEALITSAKEGTTNYIPYTLAWMPGQDHKTVELLAWAAKHHPAPWVRKFSIFFVVEFGKNEMLANELLQDRIHDPDYQVRKEVFDQRMRRFTG